MKGTVNLITSGSKSGQELTEEPIDTVFIKYLSRKPLALIRGSSHK